MISKKCKEALKRLGVSTLAILVFTGSISTSSVTTLHTNAATTKSEVSNNDLEDEDKTVDSPSVEENRVSSTSEFLVVGDCAPTVSGRYGQPVHLILPIYNMGLEMVTNLIVTPVTSTKVEEWPFQLTTTGLVQAVNNIPPFLI